MPLPEDPDSPLVVDLVEQKLRPWPVDAVALQLLVRMCEPFGMDRLTAAGAQLDGVDELAGARTNIVLLITCADAMGIGAAALKGLDTTCAGMLRGRTELFVIGTEGEQETTTIRTADVWENGLLMRLHAIHGYSCQTLARCVGADHSDHYIYSRPTIAVARWCMEQLLLLLERARLPESLAVLCKRALRSGNGLLCNDDVWQTRLLRLMVGADSNPASISGALARAAVQDATPCTSRMPPGGAGELALTCSLQDVYCSGSVAVGYKTWKLRPSFEDGANTAAGVLLECSREEEHEEEAY